MDFLFAEYFSYLDEHKFQLFYYYYDPVILVFMCELTFVYTFSLVKLLKVHFDNLYVITNIQYPF